MTRDLMDDFHTLPAAARKRVHRYLCRMALEVWNDYTAASGPIRYSDSVVGMAHTVESQLPTEAFQAAFDSSDDVAAAIAQRYLEPIAALQDFDLELPDKIQFAYYAIYNAFRKYAAGESTDDWLIVNQALSAMPANADIRALLDTAIKQATQDVTRPGPSSGSLKGDKACT